MAEQGRVAKSKLKDGLTPKQAKFVKGIAEGKTQTQAAMEAYNTSEHVGSVIAVENMEKPSVKAAIEKAIDFHNISANEAVLPVRLALDYEGETHKDTVETKLKGLYAYLKLAQFIEPEKQGGGNTFVFNSGQATNNFVKK